MALPSPCSARRGWSLACYRSATRHAYPESQYMPSAHTLSAEVMWYILQCTHLNPVCRSSVPSERCLWTRYFPLLSLRSHSAHCSLMTQSATQHAAALIPSELAHSSCCAHHAGREIRSALTMLLHCSGILAECHCCAPLCLSARILAGRTPVVQHPLHSCYIHRCDPVLLASPSRHP